MAELILGSTTAISESGGTLTFGGGATDVAKIASGAFSSVNYIDIQGCFTSDYKFYKLHAGGFASVDTAHMRVGYLNSSNAHITSANYIMKGFEIKNASSSGASRWTEAPTTGTRGPQTDTSGFRIINTWTHEYGSTGFEGQTLDFTFYDPLVTEKQMVSWESTFNQSGYVGRTMYFGMHDSTLAAHGIRMILTTGNFEAKGHWVLHGYKI